MNQDAVTKVIEALPQQKSNSDYESSSTPERFVCHDFQRVQEIRKILESRLPWSAHVYNSAKMFDRFFPKIRVYSLDGCLTSNAIVLINASREDYGQDIQISVPQNFQATEDIKVAFSSTNAIDWNNSAYLFSSVDRSISPTIVEISAIVKGNSTNWIPHTYFIMNQEEAMNLSVESQDEKTTEVRSLNTEEGVQFLVNQWKFTLPGTEEYVRRVVANNPSAGLYLKESNTVLSGIIANSSGLVGMLSTLQEERQKGYAVAVMRSVLKNLAKEGFIPTSSCEVKNIASANFHRKVGMHESHVVDDIIYCHSYK